MKRPLFLLRVLAALLCLTLAGAAAAQNGEADRAATQEWLATAERAEKMIDGADAPDVDFERLRGELVTYRETFASTREQNSSRLRTLKSQLDALGPAPENGDEPADIAQLRQQLNTQLENLRVPRVVAEEAYNRADGLITEIDRIMRDRQAQELMSRVPSPLNPANWPGAYANVRGFAVALSDEIGTAWNAPSVRRELQGRWPVLALMVAVGLVLLVRGRAWSKRFGSYMRHFGGTGTGVWSFVVSLARIVLPLLGVVVLCQAGELSGLAGIRGNVLLDRIPIWSAVLLVFRWLSDQIYSRAEDDRLAVIDPDKRRQSRLLSDFLALMLVIAGAIGMLNEVENLSPDALAVLLFPVIVVTSLLLLRFQNVLLRVPEPTETEDSDGTGQGKVVRFVQNLTILIAVTAPLLGAFGYIRAASALVFPAVLTFGLIGALLSLQQFFVDLYAWATRRGESARDSLVSVLFTFMLTMLALPLLALIWGARVSDLTELWTKFVAGFQIGDTLIAPSDFLTVAVVFAAGYTLTRLIQGGLRTSLLPKTAIDPGGQNAIVAGTGYIGIFLAALIAITMAGLDLSSLAIVAGALSVGIGFGLQTIVSNFVSGIILLIERPISKGDWIEVGGMMGYVRDISVRSTRIETFDRTDVIVPNSDLISGTVTNFTRGNTVGRVIVPVGVAHGTDTRLVEKIMLEIANAHPMVLANPPPNIVFQGFGDHALNLEIRAILRDVNWVMSVKSDMNHEIARRFAEEGIEIPVAQRDVWLRNPETLSAPIQTPAQAPTQPLTQAVSAGQGPGDQAQTDMDNAPDII